MWARSLSGSRPGGLGTAPRGREGLVREPPGKAVGSPLKAADSLALVGVAGGLDPGGRESLGPRRWQDWTRAPRFCPEASLLC